MTPARSRLGPVAAFALCALFATAPSALAQGPVRTPRVHALVGATVVTSPGRSIPSATVVVRDGLIEAVGPNAAVPADARVWEVDSLFIYPGLIDPAMPVGVPEAEAGKEKEAAADMGHALSVVRPDRRIAEGMTLKPADRDARRGQGILVARAVPDKGVFRGQAAVLTLGDAPLRETILVPEAGQVLSFAGGGSGYPGSTMGVTAVIRQTLSDAKWHRDAHARYAAAPRGLARPQTDAALAALAESWDAGSAMIFLTDDVLDLLRAHEVAREFGVRFQYVGSGEEYKRLDEVRAAAPLVVVPVDFPKPPKAGAGMEALSTTLEELRHWDAAPANPARLHAAGVELALSARGMSDAGQFRANVAKAIEAGLPRDAALAACTTIPARALGLSEQLGTIEPGKIANLVVVDGELFADSTTVRAVWIDGDRYEVEEVKPPEGDPRGTWEYVASTPEGAEHPGTIVIAGEIGALTGSALVMGQEIPAVVTQSGTVVTLTFPSDAIGVPGRIRIVATLTGDSGEGSGTSPMGSFGISMNRTKPHEGAKPGEAIR